MSGCMSNISTPHSLALVYQLQPATPRNFFLAYDRVEASEPVRDSKNRPEVLILIPEIVVSLTLVDVVIDRVKLEHTWFKLILNE
jgi:hypothetical protein